MKLLENTRSKKMHGNAELFVTVNKCSHLLNTRYFCSLLHLHKQNEKMWLNSSAMQSALATIVLWIIWFFVPWSLHCNLFLKTWCVGNYFNCTILVDKFALTWCHWVIRCNLFVFDWHNVIPDMVDYNSTKDLNKF